MRKNLGKTYKALFVAYLLGSGCKLTGKQVRKLLEYINAVDNDIEPARLGNLLETVPPGWLPVSIMYPGENGYYLTLCHNVPRIHWFDSRLKAFTIDHSMKRGKIDIEILPVTHWMRIPEMPEGMKNEN